MQSFGAGFDRLVGLGPHEIQFGILKRLRGTPIIRHTAPYSMTFSPDAPYEIVANQDLSFNDMQRMSRFARYWDLVANSGRFASTLPLLLKDAPFDNFMMFADWLYATTSKTHQFALERLFEFVQAYLMQTEDMANVEAVIGMDKERMQIKNKNSKLKRQQRHEAVAV
jgi:Protein of unknown function (DUF4080)